MKPRLDSTALDALLVNAYVSATTEVLKTMVGLDVGMKGISASPKYTPVGDISAIIGVTGESGEGMLGISFPMSLATLVVSRLLSLPPQKINSDDRCDAIGELANMITGKAKMSLMQEGASPYKLSLPTIILGAGHGISTHPKNTPFLVMTFEMEGEEFNLQVCFKMNG
ncbi:MAG TPA: chemotaxis protein CheX [Coleofasciculaceae cyanobacterium]|jgi:chemotaxis protein CheX